MTNGTDEGGAGGAGYGEHRRPDPPSAWEMYEAENELEFLDAVSGDDPPFDVEHSLPAAEELYTDNAIRWGFLRRKRPKDDVVEAPKAGRGTRFYLVLATCVVALIAIVGCSVGVAKSKQASALSPGQARAARDTQLLNLLFSTYQRAGLETAALTHNGSPQFQALQWLADVDKRNAEIGPTIIQRYVLAVMYFAMGGTEWSSKETKWMSSYHECEWNFGLSSDQAPPSSNTNNWRIGVICNGSAKQVDHIVLPNNKLKGELPPEIGLLPSLVHLSLFKNEITGQLPQSLSLLTNLKFLNVESNLLTGQLGNWFSFPNLEYLTLGANQLSGSLPSSFYDMPSLREVALDKNMFTGGVDVFNECKDLKVLYLQKNQLDGTLQSDTFASLSSLQEMDLSENKLQGVVPNHFYKVSKIALHLNQLTGTIPAVPYDGSHNLSYLSLYQNKIEGSIPASIGFLTDLTHLDLSKNRLTGVIPDELQELTNLEYLFLQKNPFTAGRIPSLYGLSNLKELSLQETNRNSALPSYIGDELTNLVILDLHENALSGSIPTEFGQLTHMRFLFLNKNELTGNIPWTLMYMEKLAIFMLDQNNLSGSDAAVCGENKPATLTSFIADCDDIDCQCCTKCCTNNDPSCNTLELQLYDDNDFSRDHYVFGENLIFSRSS